MVFFKRPSALFRSQKRRSKIEKSICATHGRTGRMREFDPAKKPETKMRAALWRITLAALVPGAIAVTALASENPGLPQAIASELPETLVKKLTEPTLSALLFPGIRYKVESTRQTLGVQIDQVDTCEPTPGGFVLCIRAIVRNASTTRRAQIFDFLGAPVLAKSFSESQSEQGSVSMVDFELKGSPVGIRPGSSFELAYTTKSAGAGAGADLKTFKESSLKQVCTSKGDAKLPARLVGFGPAVLLECKTFSDLGAGAGGTLVNTRHMLYFTKLKALTPDVNTPPPTSSAVYSKWVVELLWK